MTSSPGCCCGTVDETCNTCFYGKDADTLCCRLDARDVLMYNNPRAGFSKKIYQPLANCPDCTPMPEATLSYPRAEDIIIRYNHQPSNNSTGRDYSWFFDAGGFGAASYDQGGGEQIKCNLVPSPTTAKSCCVNGAGSGSSMEYPLGPNVNACDFTSGGFLKELQSKAVQQGDPSPPAFDVVTDTNPCTNFDGSASTVTCKCPYAGSDAWSWINGDLLLASNNDNSFEYEHYTLGGGTNVAFQGRYNRLGRTLLAVFHQEIWFRACEKYPSDIPEALGDAPEQEEINDALEGAIWKCRAPEWWAYACSGIPIYSWEVRKMVDAGLISSAQELDFFQSVYANTPIERTALGRQTLETFETRHWNDVDQSKGLSLLGIRDWVGYTQANGVDVPDSQRKIIRKDLYQSKGGQGGVPFSDRIVEDEFYYGRNGGWAHICRKPKAGNYTANDVINDMPQVPRGVGYRTDDLCRCAGIDGSCLSAFAGPYGTPTCSNANTVCGCDLCTLRNRASDCDSSWFSPATGCDLGVQTACDSEDSGAYIGLCQLTKFNASCGGIHFQFSGIDAIQDANGVDEVSFQCLEENHAHLWVLNRTCEEGLDTTKPYTCTNPKCNAGPYNDLGDVSTNIATPTASNFTRCINAATPTNSFCSGSSGTTLLSNGTLCEIQFDSPVDNKKEKPGNPMKPPYVIGTDCGTYLCTEKDSSLSLGACCKTVGGVTTCVDAVTQAQCAECNTESGVTAVWKGPNSCCDSNPC